MGIHICFMKNNEDHPKWDYLRQSNDSAFPGLIDWGKVEFRDSDEEFFRPTDIKELKDRINATDWLNKKRYLDLADLVRQNPEYWMYFSF